MQSNITQFVSFEILTRNYKRKPLLYFFCRIKKLIDMQYDGKKSWKVVYKRQNLSKLQSLIFSFYILSNKIFNLKLKRADKR